MELTQKDIDRFWSKVDIKGEDECWEWKASKTRNGYGQFAINKKQYSSHRISWILTYGDIPEGLCVCHHCDVRSCCRPDHFFLGSQKLNRQDMINKNRNSKKQYKLTEQQVLEIRQKYIPRIYTHKILAEEYNVSQINIGNIINRKIWKHLL